MQKNQKRAPLKTLTPSLPVIIHGGGLHTTGATRLAIAALQATGVTTLMLTCPPEAVPLYQKTLPGTLSIYPITSSDTFSFYGKDAKIAVLGPGNGIIPLTKHCVLSALSLNIPCVLDADALSVFVSSSPSLFSAIKAPTVLTPHEGEFIRLFPHIQGTRQARAEQAARESKAIIVLKGHYTIIATPDGRTHISHNAPSWLATAGTGDILTGLIAGMLSWDLTPFEATCTAVRLHSKAAEKSGFGMIADDLPAAVMSLKGETTYS